jgi:hemoglobin/transferrin/lactoferrin receptor protein
LKTFTFTYRLVILFVGIYSNFFSQEIKFTNPHGFPLKTKKVVIHNKNNDTLITNQKGTIKLKRTTYDSISFLDKNTPILTKKKTELENSKYVFSITSFNENALPEFETNADKNSQIPSLLKTINHETITSDRIYNSNVATGAELLLLSDGVTIQKSQAGGGSPIIRGFEANRVLLMVDGVRMNNAIYRGGHLQNSLTVDPFIIEHCDVIYGPSAVTYGSDAIGGVVHYKTIDPQLSTKKDSLLYTGNYFARINTATNENSHHFHFNIGKHNWASFSSVTYKQFGDIKMGEVRNHGFEDWGITDHIIYRVNNADSIIDNGTPLHQKNVGFEQIDLTQKICFKPSERLSFIYNGQLSNSTDISRFDQLNNRDSLDLPQFSRWDYGPQIRWMNSLTIKYHRKTKLFDQISSIISHQNIEESRITRRFQSNLEDRNIENLTVLGANVQAIKKIGNFSNISYGIESYYNVVSSQGLTTNIITENTSSMNSRYPDGGSTLEMNSVFALYNYQKKHFSLLGGLRYTDNDISASYLDTSFAPLFSSFSNKSQSLNGSLNLSVYPHLNTKINLDLSTGFRAPNIDDLGKIFTKDQFIVIPNNTLKPENAYNVSLGIKQKINFFSKAVKVNFYAVGYVTLLDNVIVKDEYLLNQTNSLEYNNAWYTILANQNKGNALVYGFNNSIDIYFYEKIIFHSGLSYTKGFMRSDQSPFGHIPPLVGNVSLKYNHTNWQFSVFSFFNGAKMIEDFGPANVDNPLEATFVGYPKWLTLNSRLNYVLNNKIELAIGGYNLLDIHYKTFASGISAPGRSLLVTIKLNY